jgi:hypothetical protein
MTKVQVGQVAKGQIVEFRFDQRPDTIQAIVVKQTKRLTKLRGVTTNYLYAMYPHQLVEVISSKKV